MQKRSSKQLIAIVAGLWIGVLMGAAVIAGLVYMGNQTTSSGLQQSGFDAPPLARMEDGTLASDFELASAAGEKVRLSNLRGKVVVLNFWATWCVPCVREMPTFEDLQQRYPNFVMVGVNTEEDEQIVSTFVQKMGLTYLMLLDKNAKVAANFRVMMLPSTFVIDERGMIRYRHFGVIEPDQLEQYLASLGVTQGEGTAAP